MYIYFFPAVWTVKIDNRPEIMLHTRHSTLKLHSRRVEENFGFAKLINTIAIRVPIVKLQSFAYLNV